MLGAVTALSMSRGPRYEGQSPVFKLMVGTGAVLTSHC